MKTQFSIELGSGKVLESSNLDSLARMLNKSVDEVTTLLHFMEFGESKMVNDKYKIKKLYDFEEYQETPIQSYKQKQEEIKQIMESQKVNYATAQKMHIDNKMQAEAERKAKYDKEIADKRKQADNYQNLQEKQVSALEESRKAQENLLKTFADELKELRAAQPKEKEESKESGVFSSVESIMTELYQKWEKE